MAAQSNQPDIKPSNATMRIGVKYYFRREMNQLFDMQFNQPEYETSEKAVIESHGLLPNTIFVNLEDADSQAAARLRLDTASRLGQKVNVVCRYVGDYSMDFRKEMNRLFDIWSMRDDPETSGMTIRGRFTHKGKQREVECTISRTDMTTRMDAREFVILRQMRQLKEEAM